MRPVRQLHQEDGSGGERDVLRLRLAGTRQPLFLRVHQELVRLGGKNMRSAAATGPFIPAHRERSAPRLPPDLLT